MRLIVSQNGYNMPISTWSSMRAKDVHPEWVLTGNGPCYVSDPIPEGHYETDEMAQERRAPESHDIDFDEVMGSIESMIESYRKETPEAG